MPLLPLLRRARRFAHQLLGRDLRTRVELRCGRVLLGSKGYGQYPVCPAGLGPESVVYSVGIGEDISWDRAMIERFGVQVHAFDPTPRTIAWLDAQSLPEAFHFHPVALADADGVVPFAPPDHPDYVSHTLLDRPEAEAIEVPVRALASQMQALGHDRIDVLKLDIEGAEYALIDHLLDAGLDIDQVLVEFHHRFADIGLEPSRRAVARLRAHGYRVFWIDPRGEVYAFRRTGRPSTGSRTAPV